ncbi:hypothetical protein ACF0H5_021294 [Mactra antiquata]
MAELTEEQKIIIGVCVGVSVIVLILIVVFICFIFYGKDKKRKRRKGYKEEIIVDRVEPHPYPIYEKRPPSLIYDPPPPPPPPLPPPPPAPVITYVDQPVTYVEKIPRPKAYKFDTWETKPPPRKYYSDSRWDGIYRNDPIVVPVAEPEYQTSRVEAREPETIYLKKHRRKRRKYVDDQPIMQPIVQQRTRYIEEPVIQQRTRYIEEPVIQRTTRVIEQPVVQRATTRYVQEPVVRGYTDDQALLNKTNIVRRTVYAQPLRRTKSHAELRKSNAFVGDWNKRPEKLNEFNETAYRHGRDPFLWK